MTRKKKVLVAGAVVATGMTLLLVALPLAVDPERFRPILEQRAEARLGRDVTIGRLSMRVLPIPAITVEDLRLAGRTAADPPSVEAALVRVEPRLVPFLLSFGKELEIASLVIEEPVVRLSRDAKGKWDLVEMLRKDEAARAAGERGKSVALDAVRVRGGRLLVEDRHVERGKVVRHEVAVSEARIGRIAGDGPRDVDVAFVMPEGGGRLAFDGRVASAGVVAGRISAEDLDLGPLAPYVASLAGMKGVAGVISGEVVIDRREGGSFEAEGSVATRGLVLPRASKGARPLDASADFAVARDGDDVRIDRLKLRIGETTLDAEGSVTSAGDTQVVTLKLRPSDIVPLDLVRVAAAAGLDVPADLGASQSMRAEGGLRISRRKQRSGEMVLERIELDSFTLSRGNLVVHRGPDGALRLAGAPEADASKPGGKKRGPALVGRDLRLDDVDVTIIDESSPGSPVTTVFEDVDLTVKELEGGEPRDFALSAEVQGGRVAAGGSLAGRGRRAAQVELKDVPLDAVRFLLPRALPISPRGGRVQLVARVREDGEATLVDGTLRLEGARGESKGKEISLDVPARFQVALLGKRVSVRNLELDLPGGTLALSGHVDRRDDGARYDLGTNRMTKLSPQDVATLAALLGPDGVRLDAGEPVELDVRVTNEGKGVKATGRMRLRELTVRAAAPLQPLVVSRADVELTGDGARVDGARLSLGATDLSGSLSLTGWDSPRVRFDLASAEADLDELFAIAKRSKAAAPADVAAPDRPSRFERLRAAGRLRVERATMGGLELTDFVSDVTLEDGDLSFAPAELEAYDGTARGAARVVFGGPAPDVELDVALTGVTVGRLLQDALGYDGLEGEGDATLRFSATAASVDEALRRGEGGGTLSLAKGRLRALPVLAALKKAGAFGESSLADLGTRLAEEGTTFESLTARYTLSNGLLELESFEAITPDLVLTARGTVTVPGQALDVEARAAFSESLSRRMREEGSLAAQLFWDARSGRVVMPFELRGTVGSPSAVIDKRRAGEQLLLGELGERADASTGGLLGRLLGRGEQNPPERPAAEAPREGEVTSGQQRAGEPEPRDERPLPREGSSAAIARARFGGNFLVPDLKLEIELSGDEVESAVLVVRDERGKELHRDETVGRDALAAARRDAGASRVAVAVSVEGEILAAAREVTVEVTPIGRGGSPGRAATKVVAKALPF